MPHPLLHLHLSDFPVLLPSSFLALLERLQFSLLFPHLSLQQGSFLRRTSLSMLLLQRLTRLITFQQTVLRLHTRAGEILFDPLAGTPDLHLLTAVLVTITGVTQKLTAMATQQLFWTLILAGHQQLFVLFISRCKLQTLDVEAGDLAVAALPEHQPTGRTGGAMAGQNTWVCTACRTGLHTALLTAHTLLTSHSLIAVGCGGHMMALQTAFVVTTR